MEKHLQIVLQQKTNTSQKTIDYFVWQVDQYHLFRERKQET